MVTVVTNRATLKPVTTTRPTAAARAFDRTLASMGLDEARREDPALGHRAALLVAPELAWEAGVGPLLVADEVRQLLGARTRNAASSLARRARLLALRGPGRLVRYPASQFGPDGRPYPVVEEVLAALRHADLDAWTIAAWLRAPQVELGDVSPAEWLRAGRDPAWVRVVAERTAAPLER